MNLFCILAAVAALPIAALPARAAVLTIDLDTVATGSGLASGAWRSPLGTISFDGEIRGGCSDTEFVIAGAAGNCLDVDGSGTATLFFDFDVESITFIYGGNAGVMDAQARDGGGGVVDSLYARTSFGDPAGPVTLAGGGIRSLFWQDPGNIYAALDNVVITTADVPTPAALPLLAGALALLGVARRRRG